MNHLSSVVRITDHPKNGHDLSCLLWMYSNVNENKLYLINHNIKYVALHSLKTGYNKSEKYYYVLKVSLFKSIFIKNR